MSRRPFLLVLPLLAVAFAGCTHDEPPDARWAEVRTSMGCFVIELFGEDAPRTVANFDRYADDGFYAGTVFHRIVKAFMIQGGGFDEAGQRKDVHDPIPLEAKLKNKAFTVAMARTGEPDSATSQFFVNTVDNPSLDPGADSDGYAVFGSVVSGREVVRAIEGVAVRDNGRGERSVPLEPPVILGITTHGAGPAPDCGGEAAATGDDEGTLPRTDCLAEPLVKGESGRFVHFETTHGCFVAELFPRDAPRTVERFEGLVADGFYDGVLMHRIMPGFLIQMGGHDADGTLLEGPTGLALETRRSNVEGSLAMARSPSLPDSATTQFFVNLADNTRLDAGPTERGYAVFGTVVRGMGTLRHIVSLPLVDDPVTKSAHPDPAPVIERATLVRVDAVDMLPRIGLEYAPLQVDPQEDGAHRVAIGGPEDLVPLWFHHTGDRPDTWSFSVDAPADWRFAPSDPTVELEADGIVRWTGDKVPYAPFHPDHGQILLAVAWDGDGIPPETDVTLRFTSTRDPSIQVPLVLRLTPGPMWGKPVTRLNEPVTIHYEGRFTDGTSFDSGSFSTTIGSQETVPGMSFGLAGLQRHEEVLLRVPPELGYGYHNPQGSGLEDFNGEWLVFAIKLLEHAQA